MFFYVQFGLGTSLQSLITCF